MNTAPSFSQGGMITAPSLKERTVASLRSVYTWTASHAALLSVIALGAALRFWSIGWGLPLRKAHIDESVVIFYTMRFFTGDLNPHVFFDYPTLFLYVLALVLGAVFMTGTLFGSYVSLDQFMGTYLNGDASAIYLAARTLSAALGIAGIYLVYRLGKEHTGRGLFAALIMSVLPAHVIHSHYATVDVACVSVLLFAMLYFGRYYRSSASSDLYRGSFILGLAVAVKYYPAVFFLPVLALVAVRRRQAAFKEVTFASALLAAGFFAGCPFALLDFPAFSARFIDRFRYIVWSGGMSVHAASAPLHFDPLGLVRSTAAGLTPVLLVLLGAGIAFVLFTGSRTEKKEYLFWLSFPAVYFLFLSTWNIAGAHYLLPVFPFLAVLGAAPVERAVSERGRSFALLAAAAIVALPLYRSIAFDRSIAVEDTRLTAHRWIAEHLPRGSRILRFPYTPEFTRDDPFFVRVDWEGKLQGSDADVLAASYDFLILSRPGGAAPSAWESSLASRFTIIKEWPALPAGPFHHPRILLYGKKS